MDTWELTPSYSGEPYHVKIYLEGIWRFCTLSSPTQKMMLVLLQRATSAECGMMVVLNPLTRSILRNDLEFKPQAFQRSLKELEEVGMIRLKSRNLYEINPRMFGKGDWLFISRLTKTWPVCQESDKDGNTC